MKNRKEKEGKNRWRKGERTKGEKKILVCVCVWHEHLGCFHILVTVNSTAMNIGMHVSFELMFSFFLDIYQGLELLDYLVVLIWVFWRTTMLFSIVAAPVYISTNHLVLAYCMFLEICPFISDCPLCWHIILSSILIIFCVSVVPIAVSPLSFLILFNLVFFLLTNLAKSFSVLFIVSKIRSCFY